MLVVQLKRMTFFMDEQQMFIPEFKAKAKWIAEFKQAAANLTYAEKLTTINRHFASWLTPFLNFLAYREKYDPTIQKQSRA